MSILDGIFQPLDYRFQAVHRLVARRCIIFRFCLHTATPHVRRREPVSFLHHDPGCEFRPTARSKQRLPLTVNSCASDALLSVMLAIVENFPPADSPCWRRKFRGFDSPPGACCFLLLFTVCLLVLLVLLVSFLLLLNGRWLLCWFLSFVSSYGTTGTYQARQSYYSRR